jgi:MoxR-like ATPase
MRSRTRSGATKCPARCAPGVFFAKEEDTVPTNTRAPRSPRSPSPFLGLLGIVGWQRLEPVILAALATEAPLLLVGAHGTAKSLLLTRLAEALGLASRHYNASLLNFDDLVGFPVPQDGRLTYLQTPSTIWDAEAVFFDEVSRCRPELQNKLFPIVHERVVQGLPLVNLRHRWAAMNPPPGDAPDVQEPSYAGAEPLDVALADRFAFVVPVPALSDLSKDEQLAVIGAGAMAGDARIEPSSAARVRELVERTRAGLAGPAARLDERTPDYVRVLADKLREAGHPLSTRRAVQLARNIRAVHASLRVLGGRCKEEDAFYCAARYSIPDAAWGSPVSGAALLAAHRAAWEVTQAEAGSQMRSILGESDPLARMGLALLSDELHAVDVGRVIADSYAGLSRVLRLAASVVLMPLVGGRTDLPATTLELIAKDYASVATMQDASVTVSAGGRDWRREIISARLPALDRRTARGKAVTNLAIALMVGDERFDFGTLEAAYDRAVAVLACGDRAAAPAPGDEA